LKFFFSYSRDPTVLQKRRLLVTRLPGMVVGTLQ
jgi:hypothetical protein